MAGKQSTPEPRPCKVCGKTINYRRICNACKLRAFKARHPDRVAADHERTKRRMREATAAKPMSKCGCGATIRRGSLRCDGCRRQHANKQARAYAEANHSKAPRACGECGTVFVPAYGEKRRAYCSHDCAKRSSKRTARLKGKARKRAATVEPVNPMRVFARDGWRCHLCNGMTDRTKRGSLHPNAPELDHIVPLSKGGEHSYRNTACAHRKCNHAKSDTIMGQPSLLAA